MKVIVSIFVFALAASAQNPAGWQVLKDRKGLCQMAAPPAWTVDKLLPSSATAPDKKSNVVFGSKAAAVTYEQIVKMAKDMFKPQKMIEETGSRTWFVEAPRKPGATIWYVALSTSPVCEAQVQFE